MRKFPQPFFRSQRNLWYVQLDGRQFNLGPDKDEAFRQYHVLMGQSQRTTSGTVLANAPGDSLSVLAIIESFLEWCQKNKAPRTYEWYVVKTTSFARSIPRQLTFAELKPFHVQDWVDSHPRWAPGQKRACMIAVQRVFNWAVRQGRIATSPLRGLEKPAGGRRSVMLTFEQFQHLLKFVTVPAVRDLLIAVWETGCRPQEIFALEGRHVDLANARWIFPPEESKGKRQHRVIYLTAAAVEITKRLVTANPQGTIFRNSRGESWTRHSAACVFTRLQIALGRAQLAGKRFAIPEAEIVALAADLRQRGKDIRNGKKISDYELKGVARKRLENQAACKLGPKYCLYNFRHSFATRALESGVDAVTVAVLMGHTDTRMLCRVYQHLTQRPLHLASAIDRINPSARSA